MKTFFIIYALFLISCGQDTLELEEAPSSEDKYSYQGNLAIANGTCTGSRIAYIYHNNIKREVGNLSKNEFVETIDKIYNKNSSYQPYESGHCYDNYNISFDGTLDRENVQINGGYYLMNTANVARFLIK